MHGRWSIPNRAAIVIVIGLHLHRMVLVVERILLHAHHVHLLAKLFVLLLYGVHVLHLGIKERERGGVK